MATPYQFTQPIRYYKANDPYYYELDNLPIRQLEENILYIKGLLEGSGDTTGGYLTENSEISILNIKQLKPKAEGGRTVAVNSGRFISRVNDAFDISKPLNKLVFNGVAAQHQVGIPPIDQEWVETNRDTVWNDFVGAKASTKAYNINGLETRYTFHSTPGTMGTGWTPTTEGHGSSVGSHPHYAGVTTANSSRWPGSNHLGLLSPTIWSPTGSWVAELLPTVHLAFVQMWRGVFRTSVVDFPDASIEIPAWDDNDFFYRDSDDAVVLIDADQRIDLLVAYSLPVDSSSTTLNNYETGFCNGASPDPTTITIPTLGLVRGAGIGIKKNDSSNPLSINTLDGCEEAGTAGSARIAANSSDSEVGSNVGIRRIDGTMVHGSFPSPDDLLNLAPNIALGTDADSWNLIGQAALPLAYIVVTKGQATITADDIIDIRPFLRTTEFTYNERAGIAGANPPLSFANPAVGSWQLQQAIDATLEIADSNHTPPDNNGRAIYTDYVMGGLAYGVEGTMLSMCDGPQEAQDPFGFESQTATYTDPTNGSSLDFGEFGNSKAFLDNTDQYLREGFLQYLYNNRQSDLKRWLSDPNSSYSQNTHTYLGLPAGSTGRNIPLYPEWDMPMDGTNYLNLMGQGGNSNDAIPKPTWWMWFEGSDASQAARPLAYVPGGVATTTNADSPNAYLDRFYNFGYGSLAGGQGAGIINTCTKKIEISFPSWVSDYDVLIEYVNCGPVTNTGTHGIGALSMGFGSGLSLNKGPVVSYPSGAKKAVFQINSNSQSLPASESNTSMLTGGKIRDKISGPEASLIETANRSYEWLSYTVALPQFKNTKFGTGTQVTPENAGMRFTPKFGAAYYPSIKFTIIGYTESPITKNTAYNEAGNNYTLIQEVIAGDPSQLTATLGPVNGTSKIDIEGI